MTLPGDFVLPIDKPEGPTSHDVVRAVRRELGRRRVGHTGTLDPFASGLLLVCVGRATRLAEYIYGLDKTYDAVAKLGEVTDTLDREGKLVESREGWRELDGDRIRDALGRFLGSFAQLPPAYSAKKVRGEPAHRRMRRGEDVRLSPSQITVHSLELTSLDLPFVGLRVHCSSGTYIRALARDLGEQLDVGAHLVGLRRVAVGRFGVEGALQLDTLADVERVGAAAIDPLTAVTHVPSLVVDDAGARLLAQGRPVPVSDEHLQGVVAVSHRGGLLAIGESRGGLVRPRKVFTA